MTLFKVYALIFIGIFLTTPAQAQEYSRISSGTGFFVSAKGHVVTNEHVVRDCKSITVAGSVAETEAKLLAVDTGNDLALLRVDLVPGQVPSLREDETTIAAGDKAVVMGYPLKKGLGGQYTVKDTAIADVKGPTGQENWIQFTSSAQKGNSGGPLLDASGNVIGVVAKKSLLTSYNWMGARQEIVSDNDIAVALPVLKSFLSDNQVYFRTAGSGANLQSHRIEQAAKRYIVNVRCRL